MRVGIKPIEFCASGAGKNGGSELVNGTLRREVLKAERFHSTIQV